MLTEFLKYLQSQSKIGTFNPNVDQPVLVTSDTSFQSLEKYNHSRYRERFAMQTPSIDAFVDYTNRRSADIGFEYTATSVDPEHCTASAIFNAYGEGQCDDTATCVLRPLPMWKFLQAIGESDSRDKDQRGVIDMIRDWHEYIVDAPALVTSFTKLTIDGMSKHEASERDWSRERTAMEKIDLKAEGGEVPSDINIDMVPFEGFESRRVQIGVSALISRDKDIAIRLRVRGYESLKLAIAEEFADRLTESLDVKPIIGTFKAA